jgi:hypothetical protein
MACIFLFLSPRLFSLFEKIWMSLWIFFWIVLKALRLKPWFKFEYLNQFPKVPDLKSIQKVYFNFFLVWFQLKFSLKILKTLIQKLEMVFPQPIVNSAQTISTIQNLFLGIFLTPAQVPGLSACGSSPSSVRRSRHHHFPARHRSTRHHPSSSHARW